VIAVNFAEKLILIGGTKYAGEMKKSVFGILNYLLPAQGVMPMHCSANIGPDGKTRCSSAFRALARPRLRPTPAAP
jgi:phosphoenolpyruvate carboxykinase (ATP)